MANRGRRQGWISSMRMRGSNTLAAAVVLVLAIIATQSAQGQTFSVLHTFEGGAKGDGAFPAYGYLTRDAAGNIYGTTENGGYSWGCAKEGCGAVFKLHGNKETILHKLSYGWLPLSGVILDVEGNIYGTTYQGGAYNFGTVFKRDAGKWRALHTFTGPPDGEYPLGDSLVQDAAGNVYGTTEGGGTSNRGIVFKIDTTGKETVLYSFAGAPDGDTPITSLIHDSAGNLYGTTGAGGANNLGTVFKIDPTGKETVLYSFAGAPNDAWGPFGGVIMDEAGNLYGVTGAGGSCGSEGGCGTVFKIDTTGKETLLYNFTGGADGAYPRAGLMLDSEGNLYGTTMFGGINTCDGFKGCGVVFKLDTNNNETVLHSFTGGTDGGMPVAGLIQDAAGNVYGTTWRGGDLTCELPHESGTGCGVVFKLTP